MTKLDENTYPAGGERLRNATEFHLLFWLSTTPLLAIRD